MSQNPSEVTVITELTQEQIMEKRRKKREEILQKLGQHSAIAQQNIEKLIEMTS